VSGVAARWGGWRPVWRPAWLAAGAAALALAALGVVNRNTAVLRPSNSVPFVAMLLSNQYAAAYVPGGFRPTENRLPADGYEWSVSGGATSMITAVLYPRRRD
jgi:hypothetical protein